MDILDVGGDELATAVSLHPVCIDNSIIKKRITTDKNIQIDSVPCVLLVNHDGRVDKYVGDSAFTWANELVKRFAPPSPPIFVREQKQSPAVQEIHQESIVSSFSDDDEVTAPHRRSKKTTPSVTSVDDLFTVDTSPTKRKSKSRNKKRMKLREVPDKSVKVTKPVNSLMAAAAAMEKGREEESTRY